MIERVAAALFFLAVGMAILRFCRALPRTLIEMMNLRPSGWLYWFGIGMAAVMGVMWIGIGVSVAVNG